MECTEGGYESGRDKTAYSGLTGVWQVSGRSTITDFEEIVQMDVDYIDHWSIWRDIGILFKTVWLVVCGDDGAQ